VSRKMCELCEVYPATVPDRNKMPGRLVNRVCARCHGARLAGDLRRIVELASKPPTGKEKE
jgi:mono/diheme cytochrome c family protein